MASGRRYAREEMSNERTRLFSGGFDDEFAVGAEPGNNAFFGRNVLRVLVEGIDDFIETRQECSTRYRSLGPALLGCALWIDDEELLVKLGDLAAACVVVRKQGRSASERAKLERLKRVNDATPGFPVRPSRISADWRRRWTVSRSSSVRTGRQWTTPF